VPGATVLAAAALTLFALAAPPFASAQPEAGIPVTDPLVRAKCGTCHAADDRGRIERVSWARATPEGWQAATKRMIVENAVAVTPIEARAIVGYLSSKHGLAPEEARPVMYAAERRVRDESQTLNGAIVAACGKCHQAARALMWRRPAADWTRFVERHATRYRFTPDAKAVAALTEAAPLQTREWNAWSATARPPALAGQWLVTAHIPGRGNFHGDMTVEPASDGDAFAQAIVSQAIAIDVIGKTEATIELDNDGTISLSAIVSWLRVRRMASLPSPARRARARRAAPRTARAAHCGGWPSRRRRGCPPQGVPGSRCGCRRRPGVRERSRRTRVS